MLTEPSKNADEDFPGSLDVKPAPLRVIAEAFLTKRRRVGERMSYVVRSLHPCEKEAQYVAYQANNVNKVYRKAVCNSYSKLCSGPRHLGSECKPVYKYITDLNKSVLSACECKAD